MYMKILRSKMQYNEDGATYTATDILGTDQEV